VQQGVIQPVVRGQVLEERGARRLAR
jgi:hypothetical protein